MGAQIESAMHKHLVLMLKTALLLILSLLTVSLPLVLFLFISHLHGIIILLIINLAINSFTSILGILIGCRTTIISTAVVEIVLVLIITSSPLFDLHGGIYLISFALFLFGLLLLYAFLIKTEKDDKFIWAAYYNKQTEYCGGNESISESV